jgi:hypothetical protein
MPATAARRGRTLDDPDESERNVAIAGLAGLASTAIMGTVALCNEMAAAGVLDAKAIDRISEFMLRSIEDSGARPDIQAQLTASLTKHFADLRRKLG